MPPDAETSRLMGHGSNDLSSELIRELQDTQYKDAKALSGDEIAIEGIVYTLNNFNHPGGDQIQLFGGNDVTVQYKMIHPHHTTNALKKLTIVGKLMNTEYEYQFDTPFERDLKQAVFKIVKRGKEFGTTGFLSRATIYVTLYFVCLYFWITQKTNMTIAALFGIAHALIGLNVQHDANHGAASRNSVINDILGFGVDIIGGSKWLWMQQHWTHHA
jgi:acyl-lipid (7-3)-desaturase (Delta-4 desaturase)